MSDKSNRPTAGGAAKLPAAPKKATPQKKPPQVRAQIQMRVFEGGVDVLRETTDLTTGRTDVNSLGWADLRHARLSDPLKQKLSPEETAYVELRLRNMRDWAEQRDRADAFMLQADINRIRVWLKNASQRDVEAIAEDLIFEMQELRKLLIRRLS